MHLQCFGRLNIILVSAISGRSKPGVWGDGQIRGRQKPLHVFLNAKDCLQQSLGIRYNAFGRTMQFFREQPQFERALNAFAFYLD